VLKFNAALESIAGAARRRRAPARAHRARTSPCATTATAVSCAAASPAALVLEPWGDATGLRRWDLGVSVEGPRRRRPAAPVASFTLTDRARVRSSSSDRASGRVLSKRDAGTFAAGHVSVPLTAADLAAAPVDGRLVLKVTATPAYASGGSAATASVVAHAQGGGLVPPATRDAAAGVAEPGALGTHFRFALPAAPPTAPRSR
jgi:hypothetical protein